jgi:hypothetical protein
LGVVVEYFWVKWRAREAGLLSKEAKLKLSFTDEFTKGGIQSRQISRR